MSSQAALMVRHTQAEEGEGDLYAAEHQDPMLC